MGGIFISYRREDTAAYARNLTAVLRERFRRQRVFRDIDTIGPGEDFSKAIEEAVESCDAVLVLIGEKWLDVRDANGRRRLDGPDDYVRLEIAAALRRGVPLFPVLIESTRMPSASELPEDVRALATKNALQLSDAGWEDQVRRVTKTLKGIVPRSPSGTAANPPVRAPGTDRVAGRAPRGPSPRRLVWALGVPLAGLVLALVGFKVLASSSDDPPPLPARSYGGVVRDAPSPSSPGSAASAVQVSFIDRLGPGQIDGDVTVTVDNQVVARLVLGSSAPTAAKDVTLSPGSHRYTIQAAWTTLQDGVRQRWTAVGAGSIDVQQGSSFEPKYDGVTGRACFCPI